MELVIVFGLRSESGDWKPWEHTCTVDEVEAVVDSAKAKAADYGRPGQLTCVDYLEGSRYMFNVAYGPRERPADGDIRVYGVRVDRIVIGEYEQLKRHFTAQVTR
jgi:hypothetical protein